MKWLQSMSNAHRSRAFLRQLRRGMLPLGCSLLFPAVTQAQSYSPGALLESPYGSRGSSPQVEILPGNPPPFLVDMSAALSGAYTTNVAGTPNANDDFTTRGEFALNASAMTSRINAALNYAGSVDYFADNSSATISNRLSANALLSILPDHFLLSANAFASPQYTSRLGGIVPSGQTIPRGANSDLRNTYGFAIQPDLFFRLGDVLRSDLLPSYSAVYVDNASGSAPPILANVSDNITTKAVTERITSGDYFNRLQWSAIGSYSEMGQSTGNLIQRSATGELSYAITHELAVLGDFGYQNVKARVPLNKALSGPIYLGGLRFDYARLTGEFRVGQQYRSFSANGHLRYEISPIVALSAEVTDSVTTPGANLTKPTDLLGAVIQGLASGQIQIPASGILDLNNLSLGNIGLQNSISRIKTGTVTLEYKLDELTAGISGFVTSQDSLTPVLPGQNANLRAVGIMPSVNYQFSPSFSAGAGFSFRDETLQIGHDKVFEFRAGGSYLFTSRTEMFAEGAFLHRNSDTTLSSVSTSSGDVSTASVRLGIRYHF
jgi:uncharacterized protein (PEP-CTERM system associated)